MLSDRLAADDDLGDEALRPRLGDAQHQLAVVEEQPRADCQSREQLAVRQLDARRVAGRFVHVEHERRALDQFDRPAAEFADAQLRPLQIGEDRQRAVDLLFERADMRDQRGARLGSAVAHVDAEGVGSGEEQRADRVERVRRGAERRENLDAARPRVGADGQRRLLSGCPAARVSAALTRACQAGLP